MVEVWTDVLDVAATEDCAAEDAEEELQPAATQYAYPILRCVSVGGLKKEVYTRCTYWMLLQEGAFTAGFQDMKVSVEMPFAEAMA